MMTEDTQLLVDGMFLIVIAFILATIKGIVLLYRGLVDVIL